ncbi:MAG TPA: hypothetical protein VG125_07525 [Pirellulales bacterium]|jgi:hypothetical protein|nr:hypothetical protein [Pirellulales bacterium]
MASDAFVEVDRYERRIGELRAKIDSVSLAFDRKISVLEAERDEAIREAKDELIACHEAAARLLRGENPEPDDGPAEISMQVARLDMPEGSTVRDWAREVLLAADSGNEGLHYEKVADWALRFGYDAPNANIAVARTSFRRTMHKRTDTFERLGEGYYRLRNGISVAEEPSQIAAPAQQLKKAPVQGTKFDGVRAFFRSNGNRWSHTEEIANAAGLEPGALRKMIYASHKDSFERRDDPEEQTRKQYRLMPEELRDQNHH